ncbi:MAG TPA: hypothetical protein VMT81_01475 [Candidatus Paceibacterota bacterium]|nr:hypothetical protein [Candidatus Paceibacterota bacterium]
MKDEVVARQILRSLTTKRSLFWERERQVRPLALFHRAAREVPAYRDFLKKNRIDPAKIKTFADFQAIPPVSKKEYLRQYPLESLVWGGTLEKPMVFTSTSGSTGKPFYFPRERRLDWQSSILHEFFLRNNSRGMGGSTLAIVGFGMGAWIGGLITYKAFEIADERGAGTAIITPGSNKTEVLTVLRELAPQFDNVILAGYPPFVKDVLDEAEEEGIRLARLNLRLLFAAESFSEAFREHVARQAGIKNIHRDTLNVYGTADIGTMAHETPTAILMRRLAIGHRGLFRSFFSEITRTPTLAQYHPRFITFEAPGGNILLTGDNTIPLVRYAIGDHGGVWSFDDAMEAMRSAGISWKREVERADIMKQITELPFVYVYERADLSTKIYGAIIYPEHIKAPLFAPAFRKEITGKFVLATRTDARHNEYLEVKIELKRGRAPSPALAEKLQQVIVKNLLKLNAEYQYLYGLMPQRVTPKIIFCQYEDPRCFRSGVKQKWVEK